MNIRLFLVILQSVSLFWLGILCTAPVSAQTGDSVDPSTQIEPDESAVVSEDVNAAPDTSDAAQPTIGDLRALILQQKDQLQKQNDHISKQQQLLDAQQDRMRRHRNEINGQRELLASLQTQIDQLAAQDATKSLTEEDVKLRERLEAVETQVSVAAEAPEKLQDELGFPGSVRIPGTNAAYRIGGYVKMSIVDTFDPLGSDDRFIVSSIPTDSSLPDGDVVVSARQSRTNLDLREQTSYGIFRAFVEGDFAGDGETYRLRHAFGQYGRFLAGKTWSTFVDLDAAPEELDFEGINGRINVRQPQVRVFPRIGKSWNLILGLEDPGVDVQDGDGISDYPDIVASVKRTLWDRWHLKTSVLLREIQADSIVNPMGTESEFGWGVSLSGSVGVPTLNENDNFMFQINLGDGIGRYVNDLSSEGGRDAVFDPSDGSLETLKAFAGYLAFQHWWTPKMRSNMVYSWVNMENNSFQPGDDLERTRRASLNWIWSPIPRADIGAEILWGEREDRDGNSGTARQIQVSSTYRF